MYIILRPVMEHWCSTAVKCVSMVIRPAPWPLTNTVNCIYRSMVIWRATWPKLNSLPKKSWCEFQFTLNSVLSVFIKKFAVVIKIIVTGFECRRTNLHVVEKVLHMHRSLSHITSNTPTARFSTISNQVCTRISPMQMSSETLPLCSQSFCFLIVLAAVLLP